MPKTWYEGPFLGNGFLGSGIYAEPGAETSAVRFNVQHSEVQDHRPEYGSLFGLARLLGLYDAELTGTLTTDHLSVHNFRTQGAFLLSAVRTNGVTRWVRLV